MNNDADSGAEDKRLNSYKKRFAQLLGDFRNEFEELKQAINDALASMEEGVNHAKEINTLHEGVINKAEDIKSEYKALFEDKDDNGYSIIEDIKNNHKEAKRFFSEADEAAEEIKNLKGTIKETSKNITAWAEAAEAEKKALSNAHHEIFGLAENTKKSKLADMLDSYRGRLRIWNLKHVKTLRRGVVA